MIFGSEDGRVYGVDGATGERRWRVEVDGAVVSSPTEMGGLAIVADGSGTVHAVDPADGTERWAYEAGDAVEAPLESVPGGVLVADGSGVLTLLNHDGGKVWAADVGSGSALRTQPVLAGGLAVTIDKDGDMAAVSFEDGTVRWRRLEEGYVGSPVVDQGRIVAARDDGRIDVVDRGGDRSHQFDGKASAGPAVDPASPMAPPPGAARLWFADDRGVVRRLAIPNGDEPAPLELAWARTLLDEPFSGGSFVVTPARWRDRLVVADGLRNLFVVDPVTGDADRIGSFGSADDSVLADLTVAGDILVVDTTVALRAIDLVTGNELWAHPLSGRRFHPPAVADGTVVVVTQQGDAAAVQGIDLSSGALRWTRPTGAGALDGAPVLGDELVFAGEPLAALDPATGEAVWESDVVSAHGQPVVIGGRVVVATAVEGDPGGGVVAVDEASGEVVWKLSTPGEIVGPTVRLVGGGETVVVPSLTGQVIGIASTTGAEVWRWQPPEPAIGNPSIIDGRAWFVLRSGQVVALDLAVGRPAQTLGALATDIDMVAAVQRPAGVGGVVVVAAGAVLYASREVGG